MHLSQCIWPVQRQTYGYFPAAGHHHPLTGTKSYCLVTDGNVCKQLAQGCNLKAERPERRTGCVVS